MFGPDANGTIGPDSARYLYAAAGINVPRPYHLRWLLPKLCGTSSRRWHAAWGAAWPVLAVSMIWWRVASGDGWPVALAATGLLLGLPGILGPSCAIPVQVDMPATAMMVLGCALSVAVHPLAGVPVFVVAACIRETSPVWAALWLWSLWPLVALGAVALAMWRIKTGPEMLGDKFAEYTAHPIRTALEHHAGRWRDAWLMVAPWGICLLALVDADWRLLVLLAVAYAQLLVAADTVRLIHHAAGPPMAVAAALVIPTPWLLLAVAVHVVWWRAPERI